MKKYSRTSKNVEDFTTKDGSPTDKPAFPGDQGFGRTTRVPTPFKDIPQGRAYAAGMEKSGTTVEPKKSSNPVDEYRKIQKRKKEQQRKYDENLRKAGKAPKSKFFNPTSIKAK